jgi:hypothetical protein
MGCSVAQLRSHSNGFQFTLKPQLTEVQIADQPIGRFLNGPMFQSIAYTPASAVWPVKELGIWAEMQIARGAAGDPFF